MKMRKQRKQFWWTWHYCTQMHPYYPYSKLYGLFYWGVARIKHQQRN